MLRLAHRAPLVEVALLALLQPVEAVALPESRPPAGEVARPVVPALWPAEEGRCDDRIMSDYCWMFPMMAVVTHGYPRTNPSHYRLDDSMSRGPHPSAMERWWYYYSWCDQLPALE